jgi:hypothetical protein
VRARSKTYSVLIFFLTHVHAYLYHFDTTTHSCCMHTYNLSKVRHIFETPAIPHSLTPSLLTHCSWIKRYLYVCIQNMLRTCMHKYGTQYTHNTHKNYISQFQIDCMLPLLFGAAKVVAGRGWTMMDMH